MDCTLQNQRVMCSVIIEGCEGPATVRMVSNNGPPLPMPMQVPPGHMVQQIVDENGILTHVILSPQPPSIPGPPMTVGYYHHMGSCDVYDTCFAYQGGPNGTPQQVYPSYGPQYAPYPNQYTPHHHPHHGAPPHHMHVPPSHMHGAPSPCHGHQHIHPQGPPPSHHNHNHQDDRTIRQKARLQDKLRRTKDVYHNTQSTSPRRTKGKNRVNGDIRKAEVNSSSSSGDGQEIEEEQKNIRKLLSKIKLPQVSNVECRSALILLTPPDGSAMDAPGEPIDPSDYKYELLLSDKGKEGKYKVVYSGDATEITLQDLKPSTEYHLKVCSMLDELKGDLTESVSFQTLTCEPDAPPQPKLGHRTKTSILLKWNASNDNGVKITNYILECDQGRGDNKFVEVYNGLTRQFKLNKLTASTGYMFRLAAINSLGKSAYCEPTCYYTSGSAPSQPDPPMLSEHYVKALTISWIRRPNDDTFTLQMEDEATGHGFMTVYNGSELSHTVKNLRRNTEYKFKLCANNDEGSSRWSDVVSYRTLPDRPASPNKPQVKGKINPTHFRVVWDPPRDSGGSEVRKYYLEFDEGRGFDVIYEGPDREYICDHLQPGHTYRLRIFCSSDGGHSDYSDICVVSTQARIPDACQAPKLQGKPKASTLHLRWLYPDNDGGAAVQEYEVLMTRPDNSFREVYRGRDTDCVVAGLSPGRPYLFQVRAINKSGAGPWSEPFEVISGPGVPDPPKAPTAHCKSPHTAILNWEEPVNNGATITDYKLEWQPRVESDFSQIYFGPMLSYEVRGLQPATSYAFRVMAINSAGPGAFSSILTMMTPPSSPGPVTNIRSSTTATTISLSWKEPNNHGSDIQSYNIDIGEKHLIPVGNILEYELQDLLPETSYRLRIQAVNGIGVGSFSSTIKVVTRPLPPSAPRLECMTYGSNSLKLKWGDGKNPELLHYCLEMRRDNGSYQGIYQGTSQSHKVNKLSELTDYTFRICASNDAGQGLYSPLYSFTTTKAPPPAVKAPSVKNITTSDCYIEWAGCRPMGTDSIAYILQLQTNHQGDYKQVYRNEVTCYTLQGLSARTEYSVRVCAVRQCDEGPDLVGAFSPGVSFTTQSIQPIRTSTSRVPETRLVEPRQWSDQQWAFIILIFFAILAILLAFLAQKIVSLSSSK